MNLKNHIKTYTIVLETVTPVYIGSGNVIGKKEYIATKNGSIYILHMQKFTSWLLKNNMLDEFEDFMLNPKSDTLTKWIREHNISKDEYKQWLHYKIDGSNIELDSKSHKEINTFMKDPYLKPYIAGSSLKGAIRTAVLGDFIINNGHRFNKTADDVRNSQFTGRNKYLRNENSNVNQTVFNTRNLPDTKWHNMINDNFSGIRISDSKPLSLKNLMLCQKIDVTPNGFENKMNTLRECIKPDTKIQFELSIDTTVTQITKNDILRAVENFLKFYNRSFGSKFGNNSDNYSGNILYLGGGSGFATKTVSYPLLGTNSVDDVAKIINNTLGKKAQNEHKHLQDRSRHGVSPHTIKKTYNGDKLESFGVCKIHIIDKK